MLVVPPLVTQWRTDAFKITRNLVKLISQLCSNFYCQQPFSHSSSVTLLVLCDKRANWRDNVIISLSELVSATVSYFAPTSETDFVYLKRFSRIM